MPKIASKACYIKQTGPPSQIRGGALYFSSILILLNSSEFEFKYGNSVKQTKIRDFSYCRIQGPRIQVTAIKALFPCLINKKNITFVKTNFKFLVLLSNCWETGQKKSTRNLLEGVTATIKGQPILFIFLLIQFYTKYIIYHYFKCGRAFS